MLQVQPTENDLFIALRSFLLGVLPSGNAVFTGKISGTTLTVISVQQGTLAIGDPIIATGVPQGAIIQAFGTGTGTTGTYTLSVALQLPQQVLATGVPVVQGQINRVSQSTAPNYIVMWPLRRERLETNVDKTADAKFTGTISGNEMTITEVFSGTIEVGSPVFGINIANGTQVFKRGTGTGGIGTYEVSPAQNFGPGVISCGRGTYMQPTLVTVQMDVHGHLGVEYAQIISTMFRDDYALTQFEGTGVYPCYADDPKQLPFTNDQEQYEDRWIIEAVMQTNQVVIAPLQYADAVDITLISVDEAYPPS